MSINFDAIDRMADLAALQKSSQQKYGSGEFSTLPAGQYEARVETLEIKGTKNDDRPMLAVSFKILAGEHKGRRVFMNRVIYGTKNDGNMLRAAMEFLDSLKSGLNITFSSYKQFSQLVLDVAEAIDGRMEYAIEYDESKFNSVSIVDVYETDF